VTDMVVPTGFEPVAGSFDKLHKYGKIDAVILDEAREHNAGNTASTTNSHQTSTLCIAIPRNTMHFGAYWAIANTIKQPLPPCTVALR
jgi:hypothetical protein